MALVRRRVKGVGPVRKKYEQEYHAKNKNKHNERSCKYRENNPFYGINYRSENKDRLSEINSEYYRNNREYIINRCTEYNKLNAKRISEYRKQYWIENSHKKCAHEAKYRSKKINATPNWLTELDLAKIESIYALAKTLERLDGKKRHVDHIVPLRGKIVSGLHVPDNLQILTADENLSNNNKWEA